MNTLGATMLRRRNSWARPPVPFTVLLGGEKAAWLAASLSLQVLLGVIVGVKGPAFGAMLVLPLLLLAFGDRVIYFIFVLLLLAVANVPVNFSVPGINVEFNVAAFFLPLLGVTWLAVRFCTGGLASAFGGSGMAYLALIASGALATVANIDRLEPTHALAGLGLYASNASAYFIAKDAVSREPKFAQARLRLFITAAGITGAVTVAWTIANFLKSDRTLWKSNMISSGMGVGNLPLFCAVGVAVSISAAFCAASRAGRIVAALAFAGFGSSLLFSWSRAWFLGALVAVGVIIGARGKKAVAIYILSLVLAAVLFPNLAIAMRDLYSDRALPGTFERLNIWADGLRIIRENPLMGVGLSGYSNYVGYDSERAYLSAHNVYIQTWAESGLPGLIALLALLVLVLREAWGVYRESSIPMVRVISLAVVGLIPGILVAGMFGHDVMASFCNGELAFVRGSFYLWMLAGCVAGLYRLCRNRERASGVGGRWTHGSE